MTAWDEWRAQGIPGRIAAAERGENPTVLTRMRSGFAVLGDTQFLPGYCLLLAAPLSGSLNDLDFAAQTAFLQDMALLGRAVQDVCGAARVNYGVYGNTDPYLHAHVWARYDWEAEDRRGLPAWFYPAEERSAEDVLFDPDRHEDLRRRLTVRLHELMLEEHAF